MAGNHKNKAVLSEEEYTTRLENIIRREFFPELTRLREQERFVEAVERGDMEEVMRIKARHGGVTPRLSGDTPTPRMTSDPAATPRVGGKGVPLVIGGSEPSEEEGTDESLDAFLAKNVSEEEVSFDMLLENDRQEHRRKNAWCFNNGGPTLLLGGPASGHVKMIADGSTASAAGMLRIEGGKAVTRNASSCGAMLPPPPPPQPPKEGKTINLRGTRFSSKEEAARRRQREAARAMEVPPGQGGYELVKTPQILPGDGGESPFMTWGEMDGTPLVLAVDKEELEDAAQGKGYAIPAVGKREQRAQSLQAAAARKMGPAKSVTLRDKLAASAGLATPQRAPPPSSPLAALGRTPDDIFSRSTAYRKPATPLATTTPKRARSASTSSAPKRLRPLKTEGPPRPPSSNSGLTDGLLNI